MMCSCVGKVWSKLASLALLRQPVYEKENSEFKPALHFWKLTMCPILPMAEGLGRYIRSYLGLIIFK